MSDDRAPIAFFVYKRPEHTHQALEALTVCAGTDSSHLFVFCDGPKDDADRAAVERARSIVRGCQWCGRVTIHEHTSNLGLAKSIITGVSQVVRQYGCVIVLEDDLVVSPQFLNYMNDALKIYRDLPQVKHIAAYMYPIQKGLPETFFYRLPSSWGWATWERAWRDFESDARRLKQLIEAGKRVSEFNIEDNFDFFRTLQYQIEGAIDSWAIRWYASVFINRGLCLHPARSLVRNIGHDGSGTHGKVTDRFLVNPSCERVRNFTKDIREDEQVLEAIREFLAGLRED